MYPIRQSTAITVPFFVHDSNGDAVTSLTDGSFTKRISKNGAAFGAMTVTITEMENGWYSIPLSTAHSDTLGILTIVFTNAGAQQVNLQFRVHARLPDDLAFPTVSGRSLDVTATGAAGIDWGNVENPTTAVDLSGTDIQLVDTCTTNTDMRGTDNAALASVATEGRLAELDAANIPTDVDTLLTRLSAARAGYLDNLNGHTAQTGDSFARIGATGSGLTSLAQASVVGALNDAAAAGDPTITDTLMAYVKQLINTLEGTTGIPVFPAEAAPGNAVSLAEVIRAIHTDVTGLNGDAMRGTDNAALASVATEGRLAELDAANLPTDVDTLLTRIVGTLAAGTHNPQTGDSFARLGAPAGASIAADVAAAEAAINADAIAELGVGAPTATPTVQTALMLLYMALRNQVDVTSSLKEIHNDAGTVIATKALTDDGTTYSEAEMISG